MIVLEVQDYCHNCDGFEADVERPSKLFGDCDEITVSDTIIRCTNRKRCMIIKRHLEKRAT